MNYVLKLEQIQNYDNEDLEIKHFRKARHKQVMYFK